MRLNEISFNDAAPVEGYGPGFFRIGGRVWDGAVLTGPQGTRTWGGYDDAPALLALVEQVDVRGAARHEEKDDAFCPGREM